MKAIPSATTTPGGKIPVAAPTVISPREAASTVEHAGQTLTLQQSIGNRAVVRLHAGPRLQASTERLQRFSQAVATLQTKQRGGVKATYNAQLNVADMHIDVGASDLPSYGEDILFSLWEARDALEAGENGPAHLPGTFEMLPGGAAVVKQTMEMLGEALGAGNNLLQARAAKQARKTNAVPFTVADPDNALDVTIHPEHTHYRDSLIGRPGITMAAIGGGTMGGAVDMLDTSAPNQAAAQNERAHYDNALAAFRPLSLRVSLTLASLRTVIADIERSIKWYEKALMLAKYAIGS